MVYPTTLCNTCTVSECHHPLNATNPSTNPSVKGSSTPFLCRIFQWGKRFGTQYLPVPSSSSPLPQLQPHWHGLVAIPRNQDCDTQVLPPVCWYLLISLAPLCLVVHLGDRLEVSATSPYFHLKGCLDTHEPCVPNPHTETFDPIMVISLAIFSIVALTPCIILISITIPYTSWLLRVPGSSSLWPLHCQSQLHSLHSETDYVVLLPQVSWSHSDCLPGSVLLLWLCLTGCCHELRVHYPQVITQVVCGTMQLLMKPIKEEIS